MNSKIYLGEVNHTRLAPVRHSFRYPLYFYAFDLDELPEFGRSIPFFGYNRLRPVAIHDRDFLFPAEGSIREKLEAVLESAGMEIPQGRVVLVTAARYFNYVFNPISFFYCHDSDGRLSQVVAQVNNTFGEMHLYLLDAHDAETAEGSLRIGTDKLFHVSPFFPRKGRYEFRITLPADEIDNSIRYSLDEELTFVARINGSATPLTTGSLVWTVAMHPVCASLTMPRILWQAARLHWQRGLPVFHKPVPASSLTIRPAPPTVCDRIGRRIILKFLARLPQGELRLTTPDGVERRFGPPGGEPSIAMEVREYHFFSRTLFAGDIGFGEAFTAGEWTASDLPGLLTLLAANEGVMNDRSIAASAIGRVVNYLRHLLHPNTVRGSSRNIGEHYDLSNEFFATFLDPTMTYSCALFEREGEPLEQAQRNKLRKVIEKARITEEDHVLEIGCGWGSFALEAVRRTGCRVTGITVSQKQLELARQRVSEASLEDRIEIRLCDYRRIEGRYSRVVSIEMLEAVGHGGLGPFFAACDKALEPGGRAVIQVITIPDRKYAAYRHSSDWIRKHIFPGGHLPSIGAMAEAVGSHSGLCLTDLETFGRQYAATLSCWSRTLSARRDEILGMGFDEEFLRRWEYYFAYCRAGFSAEIIDLAQIVLTRPGAP